jgi:hypothetical protein
MSNVKDKGPVNAFEEFSKEYRVIAMDLRNANGGQSSGPLEIDRPWDAYTDDQIGLMDHLGVKEFLVSPFIWNLLKRAPPRARGRRRPGAARRLSSCEPCALLPSRPSTGGGGPLIPTTQLIPELDPEVSRPL